MQLTIRKCKDLWNIDSTRTLRIDGWVRTINGALIGFEIDGPTHFWPVPRFDRAVENFVEGYRRDRIKENHCKEHGISLFRISEIGTKLEEVGGIMENGLVTMENVLPGTLILSHPQVYQEATHLYKKMICA